MPPPPPPALPSSMTQTTPASSPEPWKTGVPGARRPVMVQARRGFLILPTIVPFEK